MPTITLNVPYVIDADELWRRVWGANPESFGSWWRGIEFVDCDWDRIGGGLVHVTMDSPEEDGTVVERGVVLDDIVATLSDLSFPDHLRQEILDDNADCISADAVIQHVVYGEIIFG